MTRSGTGAAMEHDRSAELRWGSAGVSSTTLTAWGDLRVRLADALDMAPPTTRATVAALVDAGEARGGVPAAAIAHRLGFRSRFQLVRALQRDGVTSLRALTGWIRLLRRHAEVTGARRTACARCLHDGEDPAVFYRLVRRLTGRRWGEWRELTQSTAVRVFVGACIASSAPASDDGEAAQAAGDRPRARAMISPAARSPDASAPATVAASPASSVASPAK